MLHQCHIFRLLFVYTNDNEINRIQIEREIILMKDKLVAGFMIGIIAIGAVGFINNVIWMFDSWHEISWLAKAMGIMGIFIPPLGAVMGIIHFF